MKLIPCRWLIPQGKVRSLTCRNRVYPMLASVSPKGLKLLYKLSVTVSCSVTSDQPGELMPPVGLCSSHVPFGEKENSDYLGAAFHHHLALLVLLYTTSSCRTSHNPSKNICSAFKPSIHPHFVQQNHGRFVDAGVQYLHIHAWLCLCMSSTENIAVLWRVYKCTYTWGIVLFWFFLTYFKFSASVLFHEGAHYCNKLQK